MALLKLVVRRLVAQRLLALALLVTMAFAVGVLVAGPIYLNASRQAILSGKLASSGVATRNVRFSVLSGPGFSQPATDAVVRSATRSLPVQQIVPQALTGSLNMSGPGGSTATAVAFRLGVFGHLKMDGAAPTAPDQVAISTSQAFSMGLHKGDTFTIRGAGGSATVRVTAIYRQPGGNDPFFFGLRTIFPQQGNPFAPATNPVLVTPQGFDLITGSLRIVDGQEYSWDVYLDLHRLSLEQVAAIPPVIDAALATLQGRPGLSGMNALTGLDTIVDLVRQLVANATVPIYLVVFQIAAVALAVLAGVASLALTNQSFELAVLKSRGFTRGQLLLAEAVQSGLAAAGALPLGLLLGMLLARLGKNAHGPYLAGAEFPISLGFGGVMAGVLGALAGAGLLVLVSIPFVSRTILEERQGQSRESRTLLGRFPVEVLVGVLGLAAFYEVRTRGIQPAAGTNRIDPLVLLAPTLLLFAASFAGVRLLLWAFRRADPAIGRVKRLSGYLAGRRLGRSQAGGLAAAMLLLLATGLLMVSSSYRGTVLRNHSDVAHSQVGADWQVKIDPSTQSLALASRFPPGTMGVYRAQADLATGVASQATVLGIDPARFPAGAWWRSDYAGRPLPELLGDLRVPSAASLLPAGTSGIDVSMDAPKPAARLALQGVVETSGGRTVTIDFGSVRPGLFAYHAAAPGVMRLLSLDLVRPSLFFSAPKHFTVRFLKATATGPGGGQAIQLETWDVLRWRSAAGNAVPDANGGLDATFASGFGDVAAGVAPPLPTLPAFASPDVVQVAGHQFDAVIAGAVFKVRVVDVPAGFPGTSAGESFFVVPEASVFQGLQRIPEASDGLNEVWSMGPASPVPALKRLGLVANEVTSAATVEAGLSEDPQSLAVGMHYTAAAAGMVLVVVGVAVGAYFAQRRRQFEFAALRAMGAERSQMLGAMFGEESVVIAFALLTAFGIGFVLLRVMMPYLAPTVSTAFPPPLLVLDWPALAAFAVAVVATAGLGLALAARALLAAPVTSVLRGEAE